MPSRYAVGIIVEGWLLTACIRGTIRIFTDCQDKVSALVGRALTMVTSSRPFLKTTAGNSVKSLLWCY